MAAKCRNLVIEHHRAADVVEGPQIEEAVLAHLPPLEELHPGGDHHAAPVKVSEQKPQGVP
ncbi:MAG: hypothetical protein QM286_08055 [Acidobacteriota bacterium]|nr:hypothetical protein [Acidobacteriota bacterium]